MLGSDNLPAEPGLLVQILPNEEVDDQELLDLTTQLREDLLDLDVFAVEPITDVKAPDHSKGAVAAVGGWLAVNLGREALRVVVSRIVAWASRSNSTIEIIHGTDVLRVTAVSQEQQNRLIDDWIRRQATIA
jgi:hypothetical protein